MEARYSRHVRFAPIGPEGQARLASATAVVVGLGGLGGGVAELLARAGVGCIRLVDGDVVEWSNLGRQILYTEEDCQHSVPKAVAAARRLGLVNSQLRYEPLVRYVDRGTVEATVGGAGVVIDGTDNLETRYILNDACLKLGIPWVYGACVASLGMTFTVLPGQGPCLRCFVSHPPPPGTLPSGETVGILGPAPAAVAALETAQGLRVLLGKAGPTDTALKHVDVWEGYLATIQFDRADGCPACVRRDFSFLEGRGGVPPGPDHECSRD